MFKYVAKRLGQSALILLLGSLAMFVLVINSGDPLEDLRESQDPNRENRMAQRIATMGLDLPWYVRYWRWLAGVGRCFVGSCDLGKSRDGQSVSSLVQAAAGSTLQLVTSATVLAIFIGITLGIITAVRQYSAFDYVVTFMAFVFFSLPVFWFAVLLKHYAAIQFNNWIPSGKISWLTILIIAAILGLVLAAAIGGTWRRWLATWTITVGIVGGALFYIDAVTWVRRPAVGLPVYILALVGAGVLVVAMTSGFKNPRVRNSVLATVGVSIVGFLIMRPILMKPVTGRENFSSVTWMLLGCFAAAILLAVISGQLLGGFSRRQATMASVIVALIGSVLAFVDLMLSNWSTYLKIQPRPIATVGSATPNMNSTYWHHTIDSATHIVLPTIALMMVSIAGYIRYTRASMLEVLRQDYIRTARSKGISERKVITRHALRNGLIPLATIIAFDFAALIGGAVITESVFGWQGMGYLFKTGLNNVDPIPVMGFFLVAGGAAVTMNLIADLVYAILDPRITG
ncbi:ABC transporter permease [Tessaracoccus sp. OH4464_COT-324]|uniref:ABC transporter permease n=1 Tax=Tessaracoccus sp. OH4464_COT-324 TaxID=2491059 RepID=UPI000F63FFD2|nr:ABC transporter permease [Tessaracoccus sp. OH4464_COT-324]RRD46590.1 ABC transporter permease subunit [Tessaracoccus sp. OH4464_COT-324]